MLISLRRSLSFCSHFFGHVGKWLDKKAKPNFFSKLMSSQLGKQIIRKHILPNFSKRKRNQTMKFGHLIEYNNKTFHEKSYTKCGGKPSPRPFSKKSNLSISLDQ